MKKIKKQRDPLLLTNNGSLCFYCREAKTLTKDHIIPTSKGGNNTLFNIVMSCRKCNGWKNNMTLEEFANRIREYETKKPKSFTKIPGYLVDIIIGNINDLIIYRDRNRHLMLK